MSNSINDIKSFFDRHKGLQRNNRYSVSFVNLPSGLPQLAPDDVQTIAVAMGSRAIDTLADNLTGFGPGRLVPRYQKFVGGVMLSMPITNDNFIVDFFNQWFNKIYSGGRVAGSAQAPFGVSYYNDIIYGTEMHIKLLDPNGNTNRTFKFYEVYPLENLPFTLEMARPNEYLLYQVLMNYREFTIS
jgi:hypothetical protein